MKYYTLEINDETIEKIKNFYDNQIFSSLNPYMLFYIKSPTLKIEVYSSHKMVISGADSETEVKIWSEHGKIIKESTVEDNKEYLPVTEYKYSHYGSDEVGTGDYFGPITVAASYVDESDFAWIKALGVTDSKKINDDKIYNIAPILCKRIIYSQVALDNEKYNELAAKGMNLNEIKAKMHNQVLLNVKKKIDNVSAMIVVDQFTPRDKYYNYLEGEKEIVSSIHFETKAESKYLAVAVSSIIARYSFLTKLNKLALQLGMDLPKGASVKVDEAGAQILKLKGKDVFNKIAKLNYRNTEKVEAIYLNMTTTSE